MTKISFLAIAILMIFFKSVRSQGTGSLIEQSLALKNYFTITQYSTKHGLPQSQVIDIARRDNGALILSTANGIVEFNGFEFKEIINDSKYKKHIYDRIEWNEKNQVLIGSGDMAYPVELLPQLKPLKPSAAFSINNDSLYTIDNSGGLFVAPLTNLQPVKITSTGITDAECLYLTQATILIGTKHGLYEFNRKTGASKRLLEGHFLRIKKNDADNYLYALSLDELWELPSGDTWKNIFHLHKQDSGHICLAVEFTGPGDIYIGTTNGLFELSDGYTEHYEKDIGMPSVYIHSLYYNKSENCLFVGTGDKGLLKLQFKDCYSFSGRQGFSPTASLSSIIATDEDGVLVCETNGTIYRLGLDTVKPYTKIRQIYASLAEINGQVYAGTWGGGVCILKHGSLVDSLKYPQLPDNSVHAIFQDSKGIIWIGTNTGISKGTGTDNMKVFLEKEISAQVISFYELKNGTICIGTNAGAFLVKPNGRIVKHISAGMGLEGREVRCFYEDKEGKLWIGTYDGGLYCYYRNTLTNINHRKNAMLDRDVFCLAKDDYGYFYITSNHGLWRIKQADLNAFYYGKLDYLVPYYYGEETGILNTEFNGGFQNNYLKSKMGHFYFPALEGVVVLNPDSPETRKLLPVITEVIINDTSRNSLDHEFQHDTYSLQFSFSCVNFSGKYNVYYQYRLEGAQSTAWSQLQRSGTINFKMLPPGKYTFQVRAIDAFNDPNPQVTTYAFEIRHYFYETVWFKTVFVVGISLLVFLITFLRIKVVRKKQVERERTRRRIAELELNVLLAQMNPHFIFNSLNSLKYFLNTEDIKRADEFIDNFSFLLRKVMNYSDEKFISISDEIAMLRAYIDLENIRMNNRFQYSIEADEDIGNKLIPTFIIQPFVENAIKHGFVNSGEYCNLTVTFRYSNNIICCIIDDNGVGREIAGKMKPDILMHESKGIANVLERVAIKKESYGKEISIEIVDKKDYTGKARGTMVVINIEEINDTNDYN